jgi:hypothetical protein
VHLIRALRREKDVNTCHAVFAKLTKHLHVVLGEIANDGKGEPSNFVITIRSRKELLSSEQRI